MRMMEITINSLGEKESEALLLFCLDAGADQFAVAFVYSDDPEGRELEQNFFSTFKPFHAGRRQLEQTVLPPSQSVSSPDDWKLEVDCWNFTQEAIGPILASCDGSIMNYPGFDYPEDWKLYRDGRLLLGAVSHEDYAFLRLTPDEYRQFEKLNIAHEIRNGA